MATSLGEGNCFKPIKIDFELHHAHWGGVGRYILGTSGGVMVSQLD